MTKPFPWGIHGVIADWYSRYGRDLPWRREPYASDPYAILVSEVMLQQTGVDRVVPKFHEFMRLFPTLNALAVAQPRRVIRTWSGMGYNVRAVRLHKLAKVLSEETGGVLPFDPDELQELPGIGPYTAAAIACFAFGAPVPVADTNIYRVLSRVTEGITAPSRKKLDATVTAFLPGTNSPIDPSAWHQALMDIGATICKARAPMCGDCPLSSYCKAAPFLKFPGNHALAETSVPYLQKQGTFAGSSRYYRGRIVEVIRGAGDQGLTMNALSRNVFDSVDGRQDTDRLSELVDGLIRDGLLERENGRVRLP